MKIFYGKDLHSYTLIVIFLVSFGAEVVLQIENVLTKWNLLKKF